MTCIKRMVVFGISALFIMLAVLPVKAQDAAKQAEIKKLKEEIERLKEKRRQEMEQERQKEKIERQKTISNYEKFLVTYPDSPKKPDIMFQLARAYFEEEEDEYMYEMGIYEKKLAEFAAKGGKKPTEPQKIYTNTIKVYKRLIEEYPNFDMMDAVLYTIGYCYKEMKQWEEMFTTYTELAERFPKAKFAFEAHFHIGEYLFEQHEYLQAIEHYKKVLNAPTRVNFEKGIYKLGWCYYKLSDYLNAVNKFVSLVDKAGVDSDLREEAITYIAISFSEFGGVERCFEYFKDIGGRPYDTEVLHKLGDIFKKTDKLEEAIATYEKFLEAYPFYAQAPQVAQNIVDCLRVLKEYDTANKQREVLIDRYRKGGQWYNQNTDAKVRETAIEVVEKALYENVAYYFLEADRKGRKDLFNNAVDRSRKYLSMFPDGKNAYELNYWLAECLYKLERFEEAVPEYQKIAANKTVTKYGEVAAYNVVKCFEQVDSKDNTKGAKGVLTPSKKKLLDAINDFERLYPDSKFRTELMYKKGGIYFGVEDYVQARETYAKIYEQFPEEHLAVASARMVAISYNKEENHALAGDWFTKVISHPKANKKELDEAQKMLAATVYDQGAALRKAGKNLEAAVIYKRVAAEHPESEFADKALSDAGACYEEEKQWDAAASIYEELATKYPTSKLSIAALGRAAACHEKNNNLDLAITDYEKIAAEYPNAKEASGALYAAGMLAEKNDNWQRAIDNYSLLKQRYANSEYTADAVFSIALNYEKLGNFEMAVAFFDEFGKKYAGKKPNMAVEALTRAGEGFYKTGNLTNAKNLFENALKAYDRIMSDGGKVDDNFPAKSQFYLGEIAYQEFDEIEFRQPEKALKKAQGNKASLLKEVIGHYAESIRYAMVEWTTRSTYKIGLAFEEFGETWYNQEMPDKKGRRKLKPEEKIVIRIRILEQVPNFYNQAHTYYKSNMKFGREQKIEGNEWVRMSSERAAYCLYYIGRIYEEIGDVFREAPIPAGLTPEEKEMYLEELQGQAVQREDIAVEVYKNAYNWIVSEKLQNEWVDKVKERLELLMPGKVAEIEAGTIKKEEVQQDIGQLVTRSSGKEGEEKKVEIDELIKEGKKESDYSTWTPDECREHEGVIRQEMASMESKIEDLKGELAAIKGKISTVKEEIKELRE